MASCNKSSGLAGRMATENPVVTTALLDGLHRALTPVDHLRRGIYRAAVPWLGPWIRDRHVRTGIHGVHVAVLAALGALLAPWWMLALGPLVLGVPHLLADVRYLFVQPKLYRFRSLWWVAAGCLASSLFVDLRFGWAAVLAVPLLSGGPGLRRLGVAIPAGLLLIVSILWPYSSSVAMAHLHNLVAVVIWFVLGAVLHETQGSRSRWLVVAAFVLFGIAIGVGLLDAWLPASLPGFEHLSPGLPDLYQRRLLVGFAYAQAVHYGLWLRVLPEEARRRPAPRGWRASLAALRQEFGDLPLSLFGGLFVLIALWGWFDLTTARHGYFRLAMFHGPMELCALAWIAIHGRVGAPS